MRVLISLIVGMILIGSAMSVQGQKQVDADNKAFVYSGRFDFTNPKAVRYDWPGTSIYFQFTGKQLSFVIEGGARNYFNVFIDDKLHEVVHAPNDTIYGIANIKGNGWHTCRLQKRTEGEMGTAIFKGVRIGGKERMDVYNPFGARRIEFIGNSITCGYGTEGERPEEDFLPKTENVNKSYAFIVSRAFDAECYVTAHSGLGVVRNYGDKKKVSTTLATMPQRYHQVLDMDASTGWDFSEWQPDAVVINLGTNDYSTGLRPDKAVFVDTYMKFIRRIRKNYGSIPIFCLNGPMLDEPAYSSVKEVVENCRLVGGDKAIFFIGIPTVLLNKSSDLGSDYHPSYRGQLKMAKHVIPTIANVMQWDYDDVEFKELKY
ncbi:MULTISPECIES: SGNH/GDSL hydrolase family protein [unclassified Carboxylicivirga]|uniref:SGNH/GDSL hydrolase family protein n=1 Tax=Carboxylicivirga TaxID=1628153 RepID=UPI003D33540D